MMKNRLFIVISKNKVGKSDIENARKTHEEHFKSLHENEMVVFTGKLRPEHSGSFMIVQAKHHSTVRVLLSESPFFQEGLCEYKIYDLSTFEKGAGFEKIMKSLK
jgi:uncharacterized protein YciI